MDTVVPAPFTAAISGRPSSSKSPTATALLSLAPGIATFTANDDASNRPELENVGQNIRAPEPVRPWVVTVTRAQPHPAGTMTVRIPDPIDTTWARTGPKNTMLS